MCAFHLALDRMILSRYLWYLTSQAFPDLRGRAHLFVWMEDTCNITHLSLSSKSIEKFPLSECLRESFYLKSSNSFTSLAFGIVKPWVKERRSNKSATCVTYLSFAQTRKLIHKSCYFQFESYPQVLELQEHPEDYASSWMVSASFLIKAGYSSSSRGHS